MNTTIHPLAIVSLLAMQALASGCAAGPGMNAVAPGDVVTIGTPNHGGEDIGVAVGNDAFGGDIGRGAGGGLLAGGAVGMSCGPWAIICTPIAAVAGAVVGGTGGAIIGSMRGLNREQKENMLTSVREYLDAANPRETLAVRLTERMSDSWTITAGPSDNELTIDIERLAIDGQGSGLVKLEMRVTTVLRTAGDGPAPREVRRSFTYKGQPSRVGLWIENAGGYVEHEMESAYRHIADDIYYAMYGG